MNLLQKKYGFFWLILDVLTFNLSVFVLGKILDVYEKDVWYTKTYNWVLGILLGLVPAIIMLIIFNIEISIKVSEKLKVSGCEVYALPYIWILCLIIPFVGWTLFIILYIYTRFWYNIKLLEGKGENIYPERWKTNAK